MYRKQGLKKVTSETIFAKIKRWSLCVCKTSPGGDLGPVALLGSWVLGWRGGGGCSRGFCGERKTVSFSKNLETRKSEAARQRGSEAARQRGSQAVGFMLVC